MGDMSALMTLRAASMFASTTDILLPLAVPASLARPAGGSQGFERGGCIRIMIQCLFPKQSLIFRIFWGMDLVGLCLYKIIRNDLGLFI